MLEQTNMKRKTLIILIFGILTVSAIAFLSSLFHQEVPKNTIRILIDKPMDENHPRLQPLLSEKNYTYVRHAEDFELIPPNPSAPLLQFHLVRDENTRALIFLKNQADVLYDSLSHAKTEWIKKQRVPEYAKIYSHSGELVSHLALNGDNPAFQNGEIKKAIAAALPLKLWVETVFFNWVELLQPENTEKRLKTLAHLHIPSPLTLHFLTTPSREGQQMAFLTREALEKIGIKVEVHIYELSLFYAKIKKREFDLYSSRALPGMKNIIDLPHTETIPLFRWKHGLILNSRVIAPPKVEASLDYSFRFLADLQLH